VRCSSLLPHLCPAHPPGSPGGEDGRSTGRGLSARCESRTVRACMHALTHYVPTTQPCCSAGNPEGAVRHVIAQQGSQAPIQHQAGLMLLATCSLDWVHLSTMVTQPRLLVIDKVAANPSDMHRCSGHRGMCMPNVQFVLASRPSSCKLASALTCWR